MTMLTVRVFCPRCDSWVTADLDESNPACPTCGQADDADLERLLTAGARAEPDATLTTLDEGRPFPAGPRSPSEARPNVPAYLTRQVLTKNNGYCAYCDLSLATEVDHIYPYVQGGDSEPYNLAPSCRTCNAVAGSRVFYRVGPKRAYVLARRDGIARQHGASALKGWARE